MTEGFAHRPAVKSFGALVPIRDGAAGGFYKDRVVSQIEQNSLLHCVCGFFFQLRGSFSDSIFQFLLCSLQFFFCVLTLSHQAPSGFSQSNNYSRQDEKSQHAGEFYLGLSGKGMIRLQEPIPDTRRAYDDGKNRWSDAAIPGAKYHRQPHCVVRVLVSKKWTQ